MIWCEFCINIFSPKHNLHKWGLPVSSHLQVGAKLWMDNKSRFSEWGQKITNLSITYIFIQEIFVSSRFMSVTFYVNSNLFFSRNFLTLICYSSINMRTKIISCFKVQCIGLGISIIIIYNRWCIGNLSFIYILWNL